MNSELRCLGVALCLVAMWGCKDDAGKSEGWKPRSLSAAKLAMGEEPAIPHRDRPTEIAVTADGAKAYVTLPGIVDDPSDQLAVVDLSSRTVTKRIRVGRSPTGLALHPGGRFLLVLNRFSNFASVVDTVSDTVVASIPADFYATKAAFTPDGSRVFVTNRWRDAVAIWDVAADSASFRITGRIEPGTPVGTNPRDVSVSADGQYVAVGALTGMELSILDAQSGAELHRVNIGAPVSDVAFAGRFVLVATLSASTHHEALEGPDTNGDGIPGDGTPNTNFQDLQNEIAVVDAETGKQVWRYTSDTICCKDYRDVHPDDQDRHGDLLPPRGAWTVGGALPEQIAVLSHGGGVRAWVTYSASNQAQWFDVDLASGQLIAGEVIDTAGHNPHGLAFAPNAVLISHRLSETLGIYDLNSGALADVVTVGDVGAGAFPASDIEIGELFNFVTAPFSVDGDQACSQCHREGSNINKAFSMPLTLYPGVSSRMTMAYRGARITRPWFLESAMDENNFRPVINEFARIENFCCTDYTLWPNGAPADCETNPPPECATELGPYSPDGHVASRGGESHAAYGAARPKSAPTRDVFYLEAANQVMGRNMSFGDGVFYESPLTGEQEPVPLNFDGITRALGVFLNARPRLLPNPNDLESASVRRGRAIFESAEAGCSICHPAPAFAVSTMVNPFGIPLTFGPVVTPIRNADGANLDLLAAGFLDTFPLAEQDSCEAVCGPDVCAANPNACNSIRNVRFGATTLQGIWDRADKLLHDGRANGLREALCTPGHPALLPTETGYNELDGIVDSHGGTSHLSASQLNDLIAYLKTL